MNIVLTGGTGLIGSAIARQLSTQGHSLTLLSRSAKNSIAPGIPTIQWDAETDGPWVEKVAIADAVINLAGESVGAGRWTKAQKKRIVQSRVNATNALVRAMEKASRKPRVLVNASAVGYYGHVKEGDVAEAASPGNDFLAETTVAWETAAMKAEKVGVRVVLIRTGFVIASHAPAFRKMILPFKFFAGGPFGSGKQWFPWVHIEDVVGGYLFALDNDSISGPVNLVSPNPVRVSELARELGRSLHRPSFLPAPAAGLKILLGEMSDLLLKGQRAVPDVLIKKGFTFRFQTLGAALKNVLSK